MSALDPKERSPQRIALLPGDGIGRDVTAEVVKVLEVVAERWRLPLELVPFPWNADRYLATGETLPDGALEDLRDNFSAIFIGAYGDPRVPDMKHAADILLGIRFGLDLYVNYRPIKLYSDALCPLRGKTKDDVDFVVFRENTEGAYVGMGGNFKTGTADEVAVQEEVHSRRGVERIIRAAFEWAVAHGKSRVCMSDKSNVMRFAGDLWQRCFAEVAQEYPDLETEHWFVDALAMQLVRKPERFEVIVTNNMFGDILTDLGAALQGGLGVAASANLHPGRVSMFEPVHGSAPKHAGTGRANPLGAILSAVLMLENLGHRAAAAAVEEVAAESIGEGFTTPDLGGGATTSQVGDRLAERLRSVPL
ncbi:MAG: isocitrate/isopropylmalate dehydrogenase family protein [Acidobacteriota bacterium]|nr:isocitrate/isopropylmalate dehydrogenase family protein [Acidobacteriota bacterium]